MALCPGKPVPVENIHPLTGKKRLMLKLAAESVIHEMALPNKALIRRLRI